MLYCEKLGHKKSECRKLAAGKAKSTSEGKPHSIDELGATGSGPPQAVAQQVSTLTVSGRDPEEHVFISMLAQPLCAHTGLMLLDSGAAVFACPPSFVGNNVNFASADHFGTTSVRKQLGNQAYDTNSEVAAVSGPIASLSWLEDAGWTFVNNHAGRRLRRGQEEIEAFRRDGVYLIRVDDSRNAETALRLCPFSAGGAEEPARQVRVQKIPIFPDDSTRSAHQMAHFLPRSWCDRCVKGFPMEDHHQEQCVPEIHRLSRLSLTRSNGDGRRTTAGPQSSKRYHLATRK